MNHDKIRFSVAEGTREEPVAFRAFGALISVEHEFPGHHGWVVILNADTEEVVTELPAPFVGAHITLLIESMHNIWARGYMTGGHDAIEEVQRILGVRR